MELTEEDIRTLMAQCYRLATKSPDRSTQNAATIVFRSTTTALAYCGQSCNHFPNGMDPDDPILHMRPAKYRIIVHAERGAIFRAAREGCSTDGATMVAPWAACPECAQAIVQSGISTLVVHKERIDATPERWKDEVARGMWILRKGGVHVRMIEGSVEADVSILFDGKKINV